MPSSAAIVQPRHDLTPAEIDFIEDRLYEHNSAATGRDDGESMGFVIKASWLRWFRRRVRYAPVLK